MVAIFPASRKSRPGWWLVACNLAWQQLIRRQGPQKGRGDVLWRCLRHVRFWDSNFHFALVAQRFSERAAESAFL